MLSQVTKKNLFIRSILYIFITFGMIHCSDNDSGIPLSRIGKSEGALKIITWQGYMERGEKNPEFDWISNFEKTTGCKVKVKYATTSDEMVSLMNGGGYDLVTASGDASLRLIHGNLVQELNLDLIPNWELIDPRLKNAPWHTVDRKHFGVPYQWGANFLMYNTNVFKTPPKSWEVVFEEQILPDGLSNRNRVQAFEGPIYLADAALYLMYRDKYLNIKNPYELNKEQFSAVISLLHKQKNIIGKYWHDASIQVEDFHSGEFIVSSSWPYQVNLLQKMGAPIASTIPREGVTGWADSTMLHINSKNRNCAYRWMNHSLEAKTQGDVAAWFGSVPSVLSACKNNSMLGENGCVQNGLNNFDKVWFWRTPIENCKTQSRCVPYYEWVKEMIPVLKP